MKEGYSRKSLEEIVGPRNLQYLFDLTNHPGWDVMKQVNKEVKSDWIEQTASIDLSLKTDEEMIRTLRIRNGMIRGVDTFIHYIEAKQKEAVDRAEKERKKQQGLQQQKNRL